MKKAIAIFLCMVIMTVMIPSFFASAAPLPAEEGVVVAANDTEDPTGIIAVFLKFIELWGGLFKTVVGSDIWQNFLPALKKVLSLVSLNEFFKTISALWQNING